jgi:hypothetical protein
MKSKIRKKLARLDIPEGRRGRKGQGPLAPIRSVMFSDNTTGGELARKLQERVGESSRSLYERAKEHQADKENLSEDSHQDKHCLTKKCHLDLNSSSGSYRPSGTHYPGN